MLAEHGWHVFVADLPGALEQAALSGGMTPVPLDVTDGASIAAALAAVSDATDGLDAVVNFAGVLDIGSLIEVDETVVARMLDINVMGTFRVNKAFFDLLRARRGRVVVMSSETGVHAAAPFNGMYAMTKHAIEAYASALRRELTLLGMTVITIRPGPFRTGMVSSIERQATRAAQNSTHFRPVITKMMGRLAAEEAKAGDPGLIAGVVLAALTAARPKAYYNVAHDRQRTLLNRLPTRWSDELLRRVLGG